MSPTRLNVKIKYAVACLGDLHFGSIYAPMQEYTTFDGRTIKPSIEQQKLNLIFSKCLDRMDFWKVNKVLLCGDLIQGNNLKDRSRDLTTANLDEQRDMSVRYLSCLSDRKFDIYGVSGTNYHKSQDTEVEERIIKDLHGTFLDKMAWLTFPNSKRTVNLSHACAKGTIYPLSALERECEQMIRSYGAGELPHKPDIIIRGHRHIYGHIDRLAYHGILVPSFQVWYPFQTAYYGALQPSIGIVIFFIDELDVLHVHHYTYDSSNIRIGDKTYEV